MRLPIVIISEKFPWWIYWLILALIVLIAIAPLGLPLYAAGMAASYGCTIDQAAVVPCLVDGVDQGPRLQQMGLGHFYMMLTFPVSVLLLGLWSIALTLHRGVWRRPIIEDPA